MFRFTTRYLGFFKFIPGVPHLFDVWLKLYTFITRPAVLDRVDAIEQEVSLWKNVIISTHKYGGIQFNYKGAEIGHIHGNGLLDMLLTRKVKEQPMHNGRIQDHHAFKNTGWISFWIRSENDKIYAIELLKLSYEKQLLK